MVNQSFAPIHPHNASLYNVGKEAMNKRLERHDGSLLVAEKQETFIDDDNDDTTTLGIAVNTRNYQTLLDNLAQRRRTSSVVIMSPKYRRQTVVVFPQGKNTKPESPREYMIDDEEEDDEEARDETVVGLPVDTRNYEAIVSRELPTHSDPGTFNVNYRRATVDIMPQSVPEEDVFTSHSIVSENSDDDDTVMGFPVNTGNSVSYQVEESESGRRDPVHRQRRYSTLEKEPRVSDPYRSSSQCGTASQDSFTTAPNNSIHTDPRASCFDSRRASNAAYVPYSSWIYIQHGKLKAWKRYFAVLSGMEFKYSKGAGHSPKGFGLLTAVRRAHDIRYGLWLELDGDTSLLIRCSNVDEFEQWQNAAEKAIERLNSQNMTSYTLSASERHEGYLFKQEKNKTWKRCFFVVGTDGYIECRDSEQDQPDRKCSGYIKAVSFADCHANGLAIQLSAGVSLVCYADSYDDQMLWYGAISAAANANGKTAQAKTSVKSCYVETAVSNHAGWLYKQGGILKTWKHLYFTLHGTELAFAKDTNSETVLCDYAVSVDEWSGHANGLSIRLISGRVWKVYAESYETAKRWRSVIRSACRAAESFNLKKYLTSRRRKKLKPVYGGWLTEVRKNFRLRRFYVIDGTTLGVANDVDNQLRPLGHVVDVGSTRDLECGMVFTLANGTTVKVICDSLADSKCWYECLNFSLK
ncbi:putative pleckstrin domain, PH-like domain superfamily [Plasmopara halstedii]